MGERRLGLLCDAIDVDQISHHPPDYFTRGHIKRHYWIECLWFRSLTYGQSSPVNAWLDRSDLQLFAFRRRLRRRGVSR